MKKVLIVEDNRDIRILLKKRLETSGFSVDMAEGGYSLLDHLKKDKAPDVVILDLMLPERSGIELLSSLKSKWPGTAIFIFSAYPEYERKPFVKESVAGFFCKTDGMDKLIEALNGLG